MQGALNKQVVDSIKNNIGADENVVDVVMRVLSVGKEAAYRRMKGTVPFSFDEVVKLSGHFGFSIDSIAGHSFSGSSVVKIRIFNVDQSDDDYKQALVSHLKLYKEMNSSFRSKLSLAYNAIPFILYARFKGLSKFRIYRWMYQMGVDFSGRSFAEMGYNEDLWALQQELVNQVDLLQDVCYIIDRNVFSTFINDISHFIQLGLINEDDRLLLKSELFALLDFFESKTREEGLTPQNKISIYLSNIDFDSCYSYYEADNFSCSNLRVYSVGTIYTRDSVVCETHKKWIESLKRYSILISGCGEMERIKFITKQRELINLV